jgi:hypothetical protein
MLEDRCWRTDAEVLMVIMLDDQCRIVMGKHANRC